MDAAPRRPNTHNPSVKRSLSNQDAIAMRRRLARGTSRGDAVKPKNIDCSERPSAELYLEASTNVDEARPMSARLKIALLGFSLSAVAALIALVVA